MWSGSPAHADSGSAQAQINKEAVGKAFAAWAAGGQTFFDDMLAPDVVWTIKGSSLSAGVHRGKQALIDKAVKPLSTRLQRQIRPTIRNLWTDGDHVIIEWDGEAVAKDGKPYRNSYMWIFRMQDGRATEVTAYLDLAAYDDVLRRVPVSR
ncbi:nuclear transport factor 2 family protein [Telluria beijingensis]|uniref:nuclear transport factor 2 family protein n=1 Tax=Telluria beijingensis TaxID=3068633 RepID=UPI00279596AC|nr:nuclear transport factor 2 family protein [Massilia sp. REN29]